MLRLNQKGFSLPMVMVIMAIVVANTVYFMGVNKNTTATNLRVATNITEDNEKRRLSAYLADKDVCGNADSPINFYNKDITQLTSKASGSTIFPSGLVRNGVPFLKIDDKYIKNTHKASKFYFLENPDNANVQTKYSLIVEYTLEGSSALATVNVSTEKIESNGATFSSKKQNMFIKIPLFVELAGNLVTRCYARSDYDRSNIDTTPAAGQTNVEKSIEAACTGLTAETLKSGANILGCKHEIVPQLCPIGKTVINAMIVTASQQTFTCGATTKSCPTSPVQQFATKVVGDGNVDCTQIESCPAWSMFVVNGTGTTCTTNCLPGYLWSSVSATTGTPVCYERLWPCPAGKYTKEVLPDGSADCRDIVYKNVDCGGGKYATDMNPTVPTDPLTCGAYSKAKTCPGGKKWFTSITSTTPTCDASYTF